MTTLTPLFSIIRSKNTFYNAQYRGDIYCMECGSKMKVEKYVDSLIHNWHMIYGKLCPTCYYGDES